MSKFASMFTDMFKNEGENAISGGLEGVFYLILGALALTVGSFVVITAENANKAGGDALAANVTMWGGILGLVVASLWTISVMYRMAEPYINAASMAAFV